MLMSRGLRLTESPSGRAMRLELSPPSSRPCPAPSNADRSPQYSGYHDAADVTDAAQMSAANRWSRPTVSHHLNSGRGRRLALKVTILN